MVDDEPLARRRILSLLKDDPEIQVVAECGDGHSAVEAVLQLKPALMFLDVQMPELDGFGVLDAIPSDQMPVVVFVTAFDRYAVKAFESHAVDYLLKPCNRTRFMDALEHAKASIRQRELGPYQERILSLMRQLRPERDRLVLRLRGRIVFVPFSDIDWIEADANYVRLHIGSESHAVRDKISSIEEKLDPSLFLRIHRSYIVNASKIRELQPCNAGEYIVVLRDGKELPSGRTYHDQLERFLQRGNTVI